MILINTLPAKLRRFDKDFKKIIFVKYSLCQTVGFDKDFVRMIFIKYSTFQFQMFQFQQQIFGVVLRMFLTLVSTKVIVKFFMKTQIIKFSFFKNISTPKFVTLTS